MGEKNDTLIFESIPTKTKLDRKGCLVMIGEKILVVDLNSGSYTNKLTGHELFNLDRNSLNGMYYGYVPPTDKVDISKIEKGATESVSGVLVVYVQAISKNNKNRETYLRKMQEDNKMQMTINKFVKRGCSK